MITPCTWFEAAPRLSARRNNSARYELLPVTESGLQDIVKRGVELAGLGFSDDQLADDIIDEALNEPGALPLVSNLLRLLCEDNNRELQRSRYKTLGGLGGALRESADSLLDSLGAENREKALRLLLALVQPGINTDNTRRSITRQQALASINDEKEAEPILDRLSGKAGTGENKHEADAMRLVLISAADSANPMDDQVDLIHETLLRVDPRGQPYWPTLWNKIELDDEVIYETANMLIRK